MKLSRRQLAASIATAAAATTLPQIADSQQPPDAELQVARNSLQASIQSVRSLELPMAVEPAVHFVPKG